MEEKKLTDEEIVKALECCIKGVTVSNCAECPLDMIEEDCCYYTPTLIDRYALDLIHRLQKENEELKSPKFASWKLKFFNLKEEFDKELAEHEEFTKKANAEIERLKTENGNQVRMRCDIQRKFDDLQTLCTEQKTDIELLTKVLGSSKRKTKILNLQREIELLTEEKYKVEQNLKQCENGYELELHTERYKNAELQKQVDELKELNAKYLDSIESLTVGKCVLRCELTKQALKDATKEILDDLRNIFIEQSSYGSDANQHIGYYDYEVKIGLVIEQIEEYAKEKYGIEYGVEVE